ncbi:uncharacterized protein HD556DRAFT_1304586 [Suillus plorans]|uniref:Uncharacterized protein n=1 Tax=Suillus plorans TaxID=116603 RepID=A0A9P7DRW2_9AGAM|nr:uncharacterized protein HD556DRAFT_1304586 [Suillus plorans]KAG1801493.1 hypothetical protein HD556DRAFT_1304586 [Suillus plorans]
MVQRIGSVYRPWKETDDLRMTQMSVWNSWKVKEVLRSIMIHNQCQPKCYSSHAEQLQKAGEVIAAPVKSWKGQNDYPELDVSDPEENSMAPAQLHQGKKSVQVQGTHIYYQCTVYRETISVKDGAEQGGIDQHIDDSGDFGQHSDAPSEDGGDNEGDLDGGDGEDLGQERNWEDELMDVEDNETYNVLECHQAQNG